MYEVIIGIIILGILIPIYIYLSKRVKRKPKDFRISSGSRFPFGTFKEHEGKSPSSRREG